MATKKTKTKASPNLISSWLAAEKELDGRNQTQAIEALNKATGMKVSRARIWQWREGRRTKDDYSPMSKPPANAHNYMVSRVINLILPDNDSQTRKLRKRLTDNIRLPE